jgi:hypothetical protein
MGPDGETGDSGSVSLILKARFLDRRDDQSVSPGLYQNPNGTKRKNAAYKMQKTCPAIPDGLETSSPR